MLEVLVIRSEGDYRPDEEVDQDDGPTREHARERHDGSNEQWADSQPLPRTAADPRDHTEPARSQELAARTRFGRAETRLETTETRGQGRNGPRAPRRRRRTR